MINFIAIVNYIIDPYWVFSHSNSLNNKQVDFNERQQKTNYLIYNNHEFNSVILGSSRTTYMDQTLFESFKAFNYSANGMYPYEYEYFLDTFSYIIGNSPKNIILGLDFFGTNENQNKKFKCRNFYEKAISSTYRLKLLYNIKAFKYSLRNIRQNIKIKKPFYDRKLNKDHLKIPSNKLIIQIENTLRDKIYDYSYDHELGNYFKALRKKYKMSNFIVYITPITYEQIKLYHEAGYDKYYFQWLKELVLTFDGVYNFMIPSNLTKNNKNFFDAKHVTKNTVNEISHILSNNEKTSGKNYIYLTKENIDEFVFNYTKIFEKR